MDEKIVVTGMGAVTPIGCGVEKYWENLVDGVCGVRRISQFDASDLAVQIAAEVRDFDIEEHMPKKMIHETDAFTQYAYAAASEAIGNDIPAAKDRIGIVMGTAMAGVAATAKTQEILTNARHKNVGPRFVPKILGNIAAAQIAISYGITGHSVTLSTACASGGDAVTAGALLLRADEADAVICVGAESILCPLVIYSLANAHTLSRTNDDPRNACRPFDRKRNGFVIGEGGGAIIIEKEGHALKRGADIYAELAGWSNNNDAYHVVKPAPDGSKAALCMEQALKRADICPESIDYINAHGTGTKTGDSAEIAALEKVFGKNTPVIGSTKGATGHMMGAGGITESIACINAIRYGIIPPSLNLTEPDGDMNFAEDRLMHHKVDIAMTNAFGFGGQNSSLLFKKYR